MAFDAIVGGTISMHDCLDWEGPSMKAMLLERISDLQTEPAPLVLEDIPPPTPEPDEVLIRVAACGVCHTELDIIEGRTPPPALPIIPGHQVVGRVVQTGSTVTDLQPGERVGVAWIFDACGTCAYCREGRENLCSNFRGTGRDAHGGYAEYMSVPAASACRLPDVFNDCEAAPLLCAGAIGYRSLNLAGLSDGMRLGLVGFGASAHLVLQMIIHRFPRSDVFVWARSARERAFALEIGAAWAGDLDTVPPAPVHAAIDTTPAWRPVLAALENLAPGGRLVINAIRKEAGDSNLLTSIDYPRHLWMEKEIKSVANITRRDVRDFIALAAAVPLRPAIECFPLDAANQALMELKHRKIRGAKVLQIAPG
jgi:propanol-preferring alcohol dehydrogenase